MDNQKEKQLKQLSESNNQCNNYVCMNSNGLIIEKSNLFNKNNCGFITDIVQKTRNILPNNDFINNIEIFFDKTLVVIQDNNSNDLNITMIVDNEKN